MKKKLLALFCALMMLAALTACGATVPAVESDAPGTPVDDSSVAETPAEPEPAEPDTVPEADTQAPEEAAQPDGDATGTEVPVEDGARMQAYGDLLTNLLENGVLPDHDTEVLPDGMDADITFALEDLNGDGQSELLVTISSAYTAGNLLEVYDYRDGELILEMSEFPMVTFYDNGTATAQWSHNQTMSEFWPFTIYVYDAETGTFVPAGSVYAMDQETAEDSFPADADADGNGRVYYISPADGSGETDVVDDSAMDAWYSGYIGSASEIVPESYELNAENIAALFGNA